MKSLIWWFQVGVYGIASLVSMWMLFYGEDSSEVVAGILITALFVGLLIWAYRKARRISATEVQANGVSGAVAVGGKVGGFLRQYRSSFVPGAKNKLKRAFTNSLTKVGTSFMGISIMVAFVIAVVIIVATLIDAHRYVAENPSESGPAGMVVFAMLWLAPRWGIMIASWLAIPGAILMLVGAIKAQFKINKYEVIVMIVLLAFSALALVFVGELSSAWPVLIQFVE